LHVFLYFYRNVLNVLVEFAIEGCIIF